MPHIEREPEPRLPVEHLGGILRGVEQGVDPGLQVLDRHLHPGLLCDLPEPGDVLLEPPVVVGARVPFRCPSPRVDGDHAGTHPLRHPDRFDGILDRDLGDSRVDGAGV